MDANLRPLLKKRDQLLDRIQNNLINWDGSLEEGIEVSELNTGYFEELQSLDKSLKDFSHPSIYSPAYMEKLTSIMSSHEDLLKNLRENEIILLEKIREIKKKDDIVDSYINKKIDSIFIDKDL